MTIYHSSVQLTSTALFLAVALTGCKVETSTETTPEAEGSGKKAVNIRVETMNREEIKDATNKAIDITAEAARGVKHAATSLASDATTAVNAIVHNKETIPAPADPATSPAL